MKSIELDSKLGKRIGFTSNKFTGEMWLENGYVNILHIRSLKPNQGNFSHMLKRIEQEGYGIKMITPLETMESIIQKKGFHKIDTSSLYECHEWMNLWIKEPRQKQGTPQ